MKNKLKRPLLVFLCAALVLEITACGETYPGARQLGNDLADKLITRVCQVSFKPGEPCGDRNVQFNADTGTVVHIYIYGVTDKYEMLSFIEFSARFRDARSEQDKRIPIDIRFYDDINGSHVIQTFSLKGD